MRRRFLAWAAAAIVAAGAGLWTGEPARAAAPENRGRFVVAIMGDVPTGGASYVRLATYDLRSTGTVRMDYWSWNQDTLIPIARTPYRTDGCAHDCGVFTSGGFEGAPKTLFGTWTADSALVHITWSTGNAESWRYTHRDGKLVVRPAAPLVPGQQFEVDVRYAGTLREITPFEQIVHAFLFSLPVFALAMVAVLHWPQARALFDPGDAPAQAWRLAWKSPAFEAGAFVAPRTPTEAALATLFAEALGVERVGADADFFALGGDSLLAVHLLLAIAQRFGRDPGLGALFATPTVEGLAARLDTGEGTTPDHGLAPLITLAQGDAARAPTASPRCDSDRARTAVGCPVIVDRWRDS